MPPESQTGSVVAEQQGTTADTSGQQSAVGGGASPADGGGQASQQQETQGQQDGNKSEGGSSTAQGENPPKSAFEAVKRVVNESRAAAAKVAGKGGEGAPNQQQGTKDGTTAGEDEEGEGDDARLSQEEFDQLPTKTRKRMSKLLSQRNEARDLARTYQPEAEGFRQLQGWVQANGMSQQEFEQGLGIMALIRTNPAEALKALQPIFTDLQRQVGEVLPDDIQGAVDAGNITAEYAAQLVRERNERARLESLNAEQHRRSQADDVARATQQAATEAVDGVKGWEAQWKSTDPDYQKKAPLVWDRIQAGLASLQLSGHAVTKDAVLKIANDARKHVDEQLKHFTPTRREIRPVTEGGAARNTDAPPKTAIDAARRAYRVGGGT